MGEPPHLAAPPNLSDDSYLTSGPTVKDRAADGAEPQSFGPIHAARSSPVPHVLSVVPFLPRQGEDAASPGTGLNCHD